MPQIAEQIKVRRSKRTRRNCFKNQNNDFHYGNFDLNEVSWYFLSLKFPNYLNCRLFYRLLIDSKCAIIEDPFYILPTISVNDFVFTKIYCLHNIINNFILYIFIPFLIIIIYISSIQVLLKTIFLFLLFFRLSILKLYN